MQNGDQDVHCHLFWDTKHAGIEHTEVEDDWYQRRWEKIECKKV